MDLLPYYRRIFPYQLIFNWLSTPDLPFNHRQISYEFQWGVQRYAVYDSPQQMKVSPSQTQEYMTDPNRNPPLKIDAGPFYREVPSKNSTNVPVQRELIFDFDMDDYNNVRTCCSDKNVCAKCWKLLILAVDIIQRALTEDFALSDILYVFSGGRGLHIWVCCERAKRLKDSCRRALVDYLSVITGNQKASTMLADNTFRPVDPIRKAHKDAADDRERLKALYIETNWHPHLKSSLKMIAAHFEAIVVREQNALTSQKCRNLITNILESRSNKLRENVERRWENLRLPSPEVATQLMLQQMVREVILFEEATTVESYGRGETNRTGKTMRLSFVEEEIMFTFLYPRLDQKVSTSQNHLLKLPFSVHPRSKKISLPLNKYQLLRFNPDDPASAPNLTGVLSDLDEFHKADFSGKPNEEIAKLTRVCEYVITLEEFIRQKTQPKMEAE